MPKITDKRVQEGKKNRDKKIRKYFIKRWKDGLRTEVIIEEVIFEWGLSESSINKILKEKDEEPEQNKPLQTKLFD